MNLIRPAHHTQPGLLAHDDVLPALFGWTAAGRRVVLVTLAGIEGGSPRPIGAQMAVCEDGSYAGYLSGGCLEQAIVLEAQDVLAQGANRMVRYGRGSPYFDVQLPCGSGLDVYFDCGLDAAAVSRMRAARQERDAFALVTDLKSGTTRVTLDFGQHASRREGGQLIRAYLPEPRLVLFGAGPAVTAIATLSAALGLETQVWAGDDATRDALGACALPFYNAPSPPQELFAAVDPYAAVVLAFHEHIKEPEILDKVLTSGCFYIGVLGAHAVHRRRLEDLALRGYGPEVLQRIRAPIGSIPQAKGQATLAIGVLAEIMAEAKACGLVA